MTFEVPFQKTVNLKVKNTTKPSNSRTERAKSLEQVYGDQEELQKIERADDGELGEQAKLSIYKKLTFLFFAVIIGLLVFNFIIGRESSKNQSNVSKTDIWYSVKLVTGENFYGIIKNEDADPIILEKVYYDYDQTKEGQEKTNEAGNLRLVKRGKETHGPSGTMEIYKEKVLYKEPLGLESKVLRAILNYEK